MSDFILVLDSTAGDFPADRDGFNAALKEIQALADRGAWIGKVLPDTAPRNFPAPYEALAARELWGDDDELAARVWYDVEQNTLRLEGVNLSRGLRFDATLSRITGRPGSIGGSIPSMVYPGDIAPLVDKGWA